MKKTQDAAPAKVGRGRPRTAADTVALTIVIPRSESQLAESMVPDLDRLALGVRHNRLDVIRTAITRGLAAMRAEIDAQQ